MSATPTIGASTVAAILGISPWASPWDAWAQLTGLSVRSGESNATRRGQILEPAIRMELGRRIGVDIVAGPAYEAEPWIAPDGWRHARPDGWYLRDGLRLVEIKTTRQFGDGWGADDSGDVPSYYAAQVLWQLGVADACGRCAEGVDLAAFATFTDELRTYRLPYDEPRARRLVAVVEDWRERYVLTGEPPPVDGSEGCRAALAHLYPADRARPVVLDPTEADAALARDLAGVRAELSTLEAREATLRASLCARIGEATELRGLAKWAPVKGRETIDAKALRKAHPSIAAEFTRVGESTRRFTLLTEET